MGLDRVLNARSVAVVGASKVATKRGYQAIRTLTEEGYAGQIYPVNPKEDAILGLPCHPRVSAIPGSVDLALITTPARTIPAILEDCGAKGVAGAVIIAGGFSEAGEEGRALQQQMVAVAEAQGIRLIGPNTSGMMNVGQHLNLVGLRDVPAGDIAVLSQSGNMALSLITEAKVTTQRGFSSYVGVGNESDIRWHEYLRHFRDDPATAAILMYVEGMKDGRAFLAEAQRATRVKPVVLLKSGRSETGRSAAGSHSGSLAGMAEVARAAYQRAGIVVVERTDALIGVTEALASQPPLAGGSVAILADGGGHATIAADALTDLGVEMRPLSERTQQRLAAILPGAATVSNPVDVAGGTDASPELFADCARILLEDEGVGGMLLVGLFGGYGIRFAEELAAGEELAASAMREMVGQYGKPIVVHSLYKYARPPALQMLGEAGVPVHDSLETACECVAALARYGRVLAAPEVGDRFDFDRSKAVPRGREILAAARDEGRDALLEPEARELLALHGVDVGPSVMAESADEAAQAAVDLGAGVAMKVVSPQILHKSDAGGVRVGVSGAAAARIAFEGIVANAAAYDPDADVRGVLVSPMAAPGVEVIAGTVTDDQFGPVILFGMGGVLVEVLRDVVFRVAPLSASSAAEMVGEIQAVKLLDGYRGAPSADRQAIARLLLAVSEVVEAYPEIRTMDLNPVIVHERGLTAVDARILLR
jgi:acetate---CoA ligase (ADP-forming)